MRYGVICSLAILSFAGCASNGLPAARMMPAEEAHPLPAGAAPFALAGDAPGMVVSRTGSWTSPVFVDGMLLEAGRRHSPEIDVRSPDFRGMHSLVVGDGRRRVELQYDAPVAPAPVRAGEHVQVFAHVMSDGVRLGYYLSVLDEDGELQMAGLRSSGEGDAMLPRGWSIALGPALRSFPLCDGTVEERSVVVSGPAGEVVVSPGTSTVVAVGRDGARYAIDVPFARTTDATCEEADGAADVSVVLRRIEAPTALSAL